MAHKRRGKSRGRGSAKTRRLQIATDRVSRKERQRRAKISASLKARHQKEQQRRAKISASLQQYHRERREGRRRPEPERRIEPPRRPPIEVGFAEPHWAPPRGEESMAFDLDKNAYDMGLNPSDYIGRESVTIDVRFRYWIDRETGDYLDIMRPVTFDPGENEQEFWSNYFAALRQERTEALDIADDMFDDMGLDFDTDSDYEDTTMTVVGLR